MTVDDSEKEILVSIEEMKKIDNESLSFFILKCSQKISDLKRELALRERLETQAIVEMFMRKTTEKEIIKDINKDHPNLVVDQKRCAELVGVSVRKIEADRIKGNGIPYLKIGRAVRYKMSDIQEYMNKNKFRHTTEHSVNNERR